MTSHSDSAQTASNPTPEASPPPQTSPVRLIILLGLLGLAAFGYYYDRKVARAGSERGFEVVSELVEKKNYQSVTDPPITDADVQSALGFAPSQTIRREHYTEQVYGWRRGLPVLTYPLYVYYRHDPSGELHLHWVAHLEPAPASSLPGGIAVMSAPSGSGAPAGGAAQVAGTQQSPMAPPAPADAGEPAVEVEAEPTDRPAADTGAGKRPESDSGGVTPDDTSGEAPDSTDSSTEM